MGPRRAQAPLHPGSLNALVLALERQPLAPSALFFILYLQFWPTYTAAYAEEEKGVIDGTELTGRKGKRNTKLVHAVILQLAVDLN